MLNNNAKEFMYINRKFQSIFVFCFAFVLGITTGFCDDEKDFELARRLVEEGVIQPIELLRQKVLGHYPGRILEIELEKKHSRYIYEFEILDANSIVWEVKIDAVSGELLVEEGAIQPIELLRQKVLEQYPGKILKIELEKKHSRYICKFKILDTNSVIWKIKIDAVSGELLKAKRNRD